MQNFSRVDSTRDGVESVLDEPSWVRRAIAIERIAARYAGGRGEALGSPGATLAQSDRRAAEDLFRLAIFDAEVLVRRVLAESLKRAAWLPRDIVLALAHDVPEVARPLLLTSPLLTDIDLIRIARQGSPLHREAIAMRPRLSPRVAASLGATASPEAQRLAS